jgi:hypothetical protein
MTKEAIFRAVIRFVFLFAYGAFLWASINHVATFFHNFEPDATNWNSSYTLAISIDLTALVLTVGVMFFRKSMPGLALSVVWFFIVALTAFSWLVNWEYAMRYQSTDLTTDPLLKLLNPILASSFAFLNLAYSVVAEFFNTRKHTAEDLAKEADQLEALATEQGRLDAIKASMKKPGAIQRAKEFALEAKIAAKEVMGARDERKEVPRLAPGPLPEQLERTLQFLAEHPALVDSWVEGSDEQLAAYLGLRREASARFWRLKALELWPAYHTSESTTHAGLQTSVNDGVNTGKAAGAYRDEALEENTSRRNHETASRTGEGATANEGENQDDTAGKPPASVSASCRSAPPTSVTVKEAAAMLGLSETYVRELRGTKKLRSPGRNKKLLLVSSVNAYQAAREKAGQHGSHTSQEKQDQNGDSNGHDTAALHLDAYAQLEAETAGRIGT